MRARVLDEGAGVHRLPERGGPREHIIAARNTAGESEKTTNERYARYAKIAIRNGPGSGAHLTRASGLRAEFVPASDPTMVRPGGMLTVQLLGDARVSHGRLN